MTPLYQMLNSGAIISNIIPIVVDSQSGHVYKPKVLLALGDEVQYNL